MFYLGCQFVARFRGACVTGPDTLRDPSVTGLPAMKTFVYLAGVLAVAAAQSLGNITSFLQIRNGDGEVTMEWRFVEGDPAYPLLKYTLVTDSDVSSDVYCMTTLCYHTVDNLEPCVTHTFDLVPIFNDTTTGGTLEGNNATTTGFTKDVVPGPPQDVVVGPITQTSIQVQFNTSIVNPLCADQYVISYGAVITRAGRRSLLQVMDEYDFVVTLSPLQPCTNYSIWVIAESYTGFVSDPVIVFAATLDAEPDPVSDLQVTDVDTNELTISFEPPETNRHCVKDYDIEVVDLDQPELASRRVSAAVQYLITGLEACTNYLIMVRVVSPGGNASAWQEVNNRTLDAIPSAPQNLAMTEATTSSISLQWYQPDTNSRCASEYILTWEDSEGNPGGPDTITDPTSLSVTYTVEGLMACIDYTFTLVAESEAGESDFTQLTQTTLCT
ncbi:tyrosine-protein phosphatase Lar-like [Procambarus clarkii]|uniref:tyrosine-protein phosphatase Lar-like n=1 Tax=Procambarus clarkii TaxID=6728 RepID=UPI003743C58C